MLKCVTVFFYFWLSGRAVHTHVHPFPPFLLYFEMRRHSTYLFPGTHDILLVISINGSPHAFSYYATDFIKPRLMLSVYFIPLSSLHITYTALQFPPCQRVRTNLRGQEWTPCSLSLQNRSLAKCFGKKSFIFFSPFLSLVSTSELWS